MRHTPQQCLLILLQELWLQPEPRLQMLPGMRKAANFAKKLYLSPSEMVCRLMQHSEPSGIQMHINRGIAHPITNERKVFVNPIT